MLLKKLIRSDGTWEGYEYDGFGQLIKTSNYNAEETGSALIGGGAPPILDIEGLGKYSHFHQYN